MVERLIWARGPAPRHFVSEQPEGRVEVYFQPKGTGGWAGWVAKAICGSSIDSWHAETKQDAADKANQLWPAVLREERARLAKIEEDRLLRTGIDEAYRGTLDVSSFDIGASTYDRLIRINEILRREKLLDALAPLARAVSDELYRRRMTLR